MRVKLMDVTDVIRSKNSGPYELTFDIMFAERGMFEQVCAAKVFDRAAVCRIFGVSGEDIVSVIEFAPARAVKITIRRPIPSGGAGDTDVYGAVQHAPLLYFEFDI